MIAFRSVFARLLIIPLAWANLGTTPAFAYEPLRKAAGLDRAVSEQAVRIPGARVVLADYGLLRKDFPRLRTMAEAEIDAWILDHAAFLATGQTRQRSVNTRIQTGTELKPVLRPNGYGRALVYPVSGGFLDGKGAGAESPWKGDHANGLATLGEAIREFLYEKLVATVLVHSGSTHETLEHYAVIDWGFDVVHDDGGTDPAGMVLRQAHARAPVFSSLSASEAGRVESLLRSYGVSSTGQRKSRAFDVANVQGTADGALLDFGAYLAKERFELPVIDLIGRAPLFGPGDIQFVQPVPRYRVPLESWGYAVSGVADPKRDNPWIWSHELARDYRKGVANRRSFKEHFENLVGAYRRKLFFAGGEAVSGSLERLVSAMRHIR